MLHVLEPGFRSTVQDRGRLGHLRSAVPIAGPADPIAFEAAQRLVGNDVTDAAIEVVGPPLRFTLDEPRLVAVTGRDVGLRARGTIGGWTAAFVRAGEEVVVSGGERTRFAYLAVSGGLVVDPVLGSRATYLPASMGSVARPLAANDALPVGPAKRGPDGAGRVLAQIEPERIAFTRGPHADRFADPAALTRTAYRVSERSDRTGVRLIGPALSAAGPELLSYGLALGSIQVPRGGEPIVALADGGTTGGYPVIGVVTAADIGAVAQAAPGDALSFYEVDRRAAVEALRAVRLWLDSV
jgi:antagonist of KipI